MRGEHTTGTEIAYLVTGGPTYSEYRTILYSSGAATFNEGGKDADFRIEGDTKTHLFFVDASADAVKIQADSSKLMFGAGDDASVLYDGTNMVFNSREVGTGNFIFSGGNVGINTTTPGEKLEVNGNILLGDNLSSIYGTGKDATIKYDATNLVINPKVVGSGYLSVLGNISVVNSTISGSQIVAYRAITALRTLDATDYFIDCTANTFAVTLPTAASITGRVYIIKNTGTGIITVDTTSSQTIDGYATMTLSATNAVITLISNGAHWLILSSS
jgi:hypothetical protein